MVMPGATPRKIVDSDDPALRQVCKRVEKGLMIAPLIDEMHAAMRYPAGIGLAAPQLGELVRVIVVKVPSGNCVICHELINPEIYYTDPHTEILGKEGCLSFPAGFTALVPRKRHIKIRAFDRYWNPVDFGARDRVARCLQHEIDHLDGVLIIDKATRINEAKK